jgi:predicted RNA binding protein YcfA (HicA-like mRNA interferase family)
MFPHAERFERWLRRRSPHAATPIHDLNDLKLFFAWAGKPPACITLQDIDAYVPTGGFAPTTPANLAMPWPPSTGAWSLSARSTTSLTPSPATHWLTRSSPSSRHSFFTTYSFHGTLWRHLHRLKAMRKRKLLQKALSNPQNLRFKEMIALIELFGFRLSRVKGSHHIFVHPDVQELINIQDVGGQAKPYQVRQFLKLVERYDLEPGDEE